MPQEAIPNPLSGLATQSGIFFVCDSTDSFWTAGMANSTPIGLPNGVVSNIRYTHKQVVSVCFAFKPNKKGGSAKNDTPKWAQKGTCTANTKLTRLSFAYSAAFRTSAGSVGAQRSGKRWERRSCASSWTRARFGCASCSLATPCNALACWCDWGCATGIPSKEATRDCLEESFPHSVLSASKLKGHQRKSQCVLRV